MVKINHSQSIYAHMYVCGIGDFLLLKNGKILWIANEDLIYLYSSSSSFESDLLNSKHELFGFFFVFHYRGRDSWTNVC